SASRRNWRGKSSMRSKPISSVATRETVATRGGENGGDGENGITQSRSETEHLFCAATVRLRSSVSLCDAVVSVHSVAFERLPLGLGNTRPVIDDPGHDEEQIGQPVDIAEEHRVDGRFERHDP